MNSDINCISMNMDIRKNPKGSPLFFNFIIFFCFFFVPILLFFMCKTKKGLKKKWKDYFVSDSYLFNQWIGAYSGSELWGVLPDFSTNFKPQFVFFLYYAEIIFWRIYIISITNPLCILVFLTIHAFFINLPLWL